MKPEQQERAEHLAKVHVDFLLEIMRPLMEAEFIHGYKHGFEESQIPTTSCPKTPYEILDRSVK